MFQREGNPRMQSVKVVLDTLIEDAPARQIVLRD
jgi:hypothetical protein